MLHDPHGRGTYAAAVAQGLIGANVLVPVIVGPTSHNIARTVTHTDPACATGGGDLEICTAAELINRSVDKPEWCTHCGVRVTKLDTIAPENHRLVAAWIATAEARMAELETGMGTLVDRGALALMHAWTPDPDDIPESLHGAFTELRHEIATFDIANLLTVEGNTTGPCADTGEGHGWYLLDRDLVVDLVAEPFLSTATKAICVAVGRRAIGEAVTVNNEMWIRVADADMAHVLPHDAKRICDGRHPVTAIVDAVKLRTHRGGDLSTLIPAMSAAAV